MIAVFKKEIRTFFTSSIGYLIISLFLIINSTFMWLVDSEFNILNYGYANLDTFFLFSPIVFLIFIPAIGMRMFAEEYQVGTIEFLLTKPISVFKLVLSKFFATSILILFALLPTLVYVITIYYLGETKGNLDSAAIIGSYFGLFFLGLSFSSISIFCSAVTSNQIVAFLSAIALNFLCYYGFDFISTIDFLQFFSFLFEKLGISYHYIMISKGIITIQDLIYFLSFCILFIKSTEFIILKNTQNEAK